MLSSHGYLVGAGLSNTPGAWASRARSRSRVIDATVLVPREGVAPSSNRVLLRLWPLLCHRSGRRTGLPWSARLELPAEVWPRR